MNIAAILASGVGDRFGSSVPKQFHTVCGKMVIEYVIDALNASGVVDKIVIATNTRENAKYFTEIAKSDIIDIIDGGSTRNKTLKCVIDYISASYDCSKLIVCDAVRPLITGELIEKYFAELDSSDAVVTAQKITDSLGCYNCRQINREDYYLMQSPEGFDFNLLAKSFDENSQLTEVTQQLPEESRIKLSFDFTNNFKLTYPEDMAYLEVLLKAKDV